VTIGPGVYSENVFIPQGRDGLQVLGTSKLTTIIDPDVPLSGTALAIQSAGVKVSRLGIRNGRGHGIFINGVDVVVQGVRIVGLRHTSSAGIYALASHRLQVLGNEVRAVANTGIAVVDSQDVTVAGNTVTQTPSGILVTGQGGRVVSNKVTGGTIGVQASGPAVVKNLIEMMGGAFPNGLAALGDGAVQGNKLTNAGAAFLQCSPCQAADVSGNSSLGSSGYGFTIVGAVAGSPGGLVARANTVSRAAGPGFRIQGVGATVTGNRATDTGYYLGPNEGGHCFVAAGGATAAHTLTGNSATRCAESGFLVTGDNVTLEGNAAAQAGLHGFEVDAYFAALTANKALSSNGAGFAVLPTAFSASLDLNVAAKNRYGLCDQGASTDLGANDLGQPPTSTVCDLVQ
jgi:hypothetical protein